jgi:outer membrane protein assembly factor BamA
LRELRPAAPGSALTDDALADDAPNLLGGDVKLEAAVELRQTLLEDVLGRTDWIGALFVDAGNAWIGPRNPGPDALRFRLSDFYHQIGVGSGLGLRLDWDFLVLRLDAAFKVHDPIQSGNPFPDGLGSPRLHFGIGHAL